MSAMFEDSTWGTGGETGIRTLGRRKPTTVFETAAFDHSATSPQHGHDGVLTGVCGACKRKFSKQI